jgi:hypothetical protein
MFCFWAGLAITVDCNGAALTLLLFGLDVLPFVAPFQTREEPTVRAYVLYIILDSIFVVRYSLLMPIVSS